MDRCGARRTVAPSETGSDVESHGACGAPHAPAFSLRTAAQHPLRSSRLSPNAGFRPRPSLVMLQTIGAVSPVGGESLMSSAFLEFAMHNHWLFLHSLDSVTTVRQLVEFYVEQHNRVLPHSAFRGQTPDEMYYGTGDAVPGDLTARAAAARRLRMEANRSAVCRTCPSTEAAA